MLITDDILIELVKEAYNLAFVQKVKVPGFKYEVPKDLLTAMDKKMIPIYGNDWDTPAFAEFMYSVLPMETSLKNALNNKFKELGVDLRVVYGWPLFPGLVDTTGTDGHLVGFTDGRYVLKNWSIYKERDTQYLADLITHWRFEHPEEFVIVPKQ